MSCPRLSFGGTVPSKKTPAHRVTGAAYSLRCRGSRRCRDAPVGAPPEGNAIKKSLDARLAIYGSTDCSTRADGLRPAPAARVPAAAPDGDLHPSRHLRRDMQRGFRRRLRRRRSRL